MTDIFEWLEGANQPLVAPPVSFPQPMDGVFIEDDPMDQITLLDIDQNGNMYFDAPHAWNPPIEQCQTYDEYASIDPSLRTMANPSTQTPTRTVVTVPEEFAEASSKILIYFAQTLEIPETSEETVFTAEELEILEPIAEEDHEPVIPNVINGVCVSRNPKSAEIKDVIDLRRIGPGRQVFYLAKTIEEDYYWFHIPRAERDKRLRQLIRDYRHESYTEVDERKARGARKLRSGKTVRI
jgi:hypothetical protein